MLELRRKPEVGNTIILNRDVGLISDLFRGLRDFKACRKTRKAILNKMKNTDYAEKLAERTGRTQDQIRNVLRHGTN